MIEPKFTPGMYYFCLHCFSTVADAVAHYEENKTHSKFLHDGDAFDFEHGLKEKLVAADTEAKPEGDNTLTQSTGLQAEAKTTDNV